MPFPEIWKSPRADGKALSSRPLGASAGNAQGDAVGQRPEFVQSYRDPGITQTSLGVLLVPARP
jgi:hypothetical protein